MKYAALRGLVVGLTLSAVVFGPVAGAYLGVQVAHVIDPPKPVWLEVR